MVAQKDYPFKTQASWISAGNTVFILKGNKYIYYADVAIGFSDTSCKTKVIIPS